MYNYEVAIYLFQVITANFEQASTGWESLNLKLHFIFFFVSDASVINKLLFVLPFHINRNTNDSSMASFHSTEDEICIMTFQAVNSTRNFYGFEVNTII